MLMEAAKLLIHSQQSQITVSSLIRKCGGYLNVLVLLCSPRCGPDKSFISPDNMAFYRENITTYSY